MPRALWAATAATLLSISATYPATANADTTYPKSLGIAPCVLTDGTIDTSTESGAGVPLSAVTTDPGPGGSAPAVMVLNCTTLTIPSGVTVHVAGTRALDLRASGAIDIEGVLDASGSSSGNGAPGPGAGAGATSAVNPGGGPGGGSNGQPAPSSTASGQGGARGVAYGTGGSQGTDGASPTGTGSGGSGGGGGGAGSGGVASVATWDFAIGAGSGGGRGGSAFSGVSLGASGGGGGGAVRLVSDQGITVGSNGVVWARGGSGAASTPPTSGSASGGGGGGGSGGFIGLIAPTVSLHHAVDAGGGSGGLATGSVPAHAAGGAGANGSIRVIANAFDMLGGIVYPAPPTPVRHSFILSASTDGPGAGSVTSSDGGIDCGDDCTDPYDPNAEVTLSATPASGSSFVGWGGDCAGTSTQCTVTMSAARAVTATFDEVPVTPTPPGTGPAPSPSPTPAPLKKKCKKKKHRAASAAKKKCKKKRR